LHLLTLCDIGDADPNILMLLRALKRHTYYRVYPLLVGSHHDPSLIWDIDADTLTINGHTMVPAACFIRYDVFTAMRDSRPEVADRAAAWHTALLGWVLSHDECRTFNRVSLRTLCNKPQQLAYAKQFGLAIPRTIVTNDCKAIAQLQSDAIQRVTNTIGALPSTTSSTPSPLSATATPVPVPSPSASSSNTSSSTPTLSSIVGRCIVKPINGGGFCQPLDAITSRVPVRDGVTASPAICQFVC
jgi:hypothetical protein